MSAEGSTGSRPLLARFVTPPAADDTDVVAERVADVRSNIERLLRTGAPLAAHLRRSGVDVPAPRSASSRASGEERSRVARSVLAYGMPDLIGRLRDGVGVSDFCTALRHALLDHEPRLDPDSVRILVDEREPDRSRVLTGEFDFRIEARVRGVAGERGALRVRTVVHPFRVPEVETGVD